MTLAILFYVVSAAVLWAWAVVHQLAIGWVIAVMIERLPLPDDKSGKFYTYVFSVLQVFAANSKRAQDAIALAKVPKI